MTDRDSSALGLSVVLYTVAGLAALSISLALIVPNAQHLLLILLRSPGRFLFSSFHLAAFYVPAVLVAGASLLLHPSFKPTQVWSLLYSIVPFFTFALLIRILARAAVESSPITDALVGAMGRWGALSILTVAGTLELVFFWFYLHKRPRPLTGGMKRIPRLLTADRPQSAVVEPDGPWEAVATRSSRDVTPRSLVDLPDPAAGPVVDQPPSGLLAQPVVDEPPGDEPADGPSTEEPELEVFLSQGRIQRDRDPETEETDEGEIDELEAEEIDAAWERSEAEHTRGSRWEKLDDRTSAVVDATRTAGDPADDGEQIEPPREESESQDVAIDQAAEAAARAAASDAPEVPRPRGKRYDVPITGLLQEYSNGQYWQVDDKTREAAETLRVTLEEFGIQAEVTGIRKGPVITMFEILPAPGVKLSKIVNLSDNIALRLAASSVRIVAPIPGKHAVGIEIPNKERAIVGFAELVQEEAFQAPRMEVPIALGKDIPGDAEIVDLTRMPHVLIAGATGSGKSVCVNSIICSILYKRAPHEVKLVLIDPKIVELKFYNDIPHLLTPVITDPKRAFQALQWCIYEMERRYSLLDALQVRDIQSYNKKIKTKRLATEPLPYIVVVVDEFADLMATSGKELEGTLARLAAMSRAVGIHLVLATQRPSTDVITGLIKANIPSRIAFMVASKIDSRIILDTMGAEKLLGRGDMLFTSAWDPFPTRMQGAFLSEDEVERVVTYVKQLGEPEYIDDEIFVEEDDEDYLQGELEDPLMEKAIEIVTTAGKASASYLQRRLKIGYNRAARIVEEMERMGIVGPQQGSKPRDIIGSGDRL